MKAFPLQRDVVEARGPDATSFLQGQLSQDLDAIGEGGSAWSFLLQPQGKVDALLRVSRPDGDRWLLDVDGGYGEAVLARLNRFKLRVKCDLEPLDWKCVAVRDATSEANSPGSSAHTRTSVASSVGWPIHDGVDLLGPDVEPPQGVDVGTPEEYERLRIEAGWPSMGAELTEKTIPAETGIVHLAVSFTKGCFTGQELVARIDSRGGHVPRHLRGIDAGSGSLTAGAPLTRDGKQVGTVTSAAGAIGLAYVSRDVEPPAEVVLEDGTAVRVVTLPFGA